jgi:hypothetical protein
LVLPTNPGIELSLIKVVADIKTSWLLSLLSDRERSGLRLFFHVFLASGVGSRVRSRFSQYVESRGFEQAKSQVLSDLGRTSFADETI